MNSLKEDISFETVNNELKKRKSSEVLTSLSINEEDIPENEQLKIQHMQETIGNGSSLTFRKLSIRFTTESGKQDSGDYLYVNTQQPVTAKLLADSIIKELTYNQLPEWKRDEINLQAYKNENKFVLLISALILTLSMCIRLLAENSTRTSPLFQYGEKMGNGCFIYCLLLIAYFFYNPSPGRRKYFYTLLVVASTWFIGMLVTILF